MQEELWSIVSPIDLIGLSRQKEAAEKLLISDDPLLTKLHLVEFVNNPSDTEKVKVRLAVLGYWRETLSRDRYIFLVSFLAVKKIIPLIKAANCLRQIGYGDRENIGSECEKAVETAEFVLEDEEEGFVEIEADDLFMKALEAVVDLNTKK